MKILETHPDGAPARVEIAGIAFVRAAPNPALVGLDRLPEVMRDGAAPAQTEEATMTDTNTDRGGAVAWRATEPVERGGGGYWDAFVEGTDNGHTAAQVYGDTRAEVEQRSAAVVFGLSRAKTDTDAREKVVEALIEALKPFADFVTPAPKWMKDVDVVSAGSPLARKQLTFGDCRRAAEALAALKTGDA